ncbi:MAG: hypothetical protein WCL50_01570 [Spirochaetota bacterium]
MKEMAEYGPGTSAYELLVHLQDRILSGELRTFQALKAYASAIVEGPRGKPVLKKAFDLQRQLHWGFFRDLDRETFPELWNQVVMTDPDFSFAGDLKGYMSIPDIYVGLLDIHGYTRFCHDNRSNMTMLDLLDRIIHEDVRSIAAKAGVLSRRVRGDEVLLLAASAADLVEVVLTVMEFFSKRKRVRRGTGSDSQGIDVVLPPFQVSAGLAGGQKFTPLVITRDGDLSGDIVNTAARLQSRAARLSPLRNRILVTSHVRQRLIRVDQERHRRVSAVRFLNTGSVTFKGVSLLVFDTVFLNTEAWRLEIQDELEALYDSLEKGLWRSKVFEDALKLAARLVRSLPAFSIPGGGRQGGDLDASGYLSLVRFTEGLYSGERFEAAIAGLNDLVARLDLVEGVDEVAFEYLKGIAEGYTTIASSFVESLDAEIEANPEAVMDMTEKAGYETLRKNAIILERLVEKNRLGVRSRKSTWFRVADECSPAIRVWIESRK